MPVRELAQAKINLTLKVLGKRPDGYHELQSLVTFADLHDVVTVEPDTGAGVTVAGPFASYISGENLLIRALTLLQRTDPKLRLGAVRLDKNLPVAAGLGGGSADAAALLRAIRRANAHSASGIAWDDVAARLGADVPVCLLSRPALMWGIGEKLVPLTRVQALSAVLVNPRVPLATAQVFAALGAGPAPSSATEPSPPDLGRSSDLIGYVRARGNDLEKPAIALLPVIGEVKAALEAQPGCRLAAMSGSGPTCFGIFADQDAARAAAVSLAGAHAGWWVKPVMLQGCPAA
jgi:4-diphosphocytidyl-2-C-methyl-D-erythritol kinase